MMKGKWIRKGLGILALFVLLAGWDGGTRALADDETLPRILPGEWAFEASADPESDDPQTADLAFVRFEQDGRLALRCNSRDGTPFCTYGGTWAFELVPEGMDRLTLTFTATDHPGHAGSGYLVECVCDVYMESWEEDGVQYRYLLLENMSGSGVSPFAEVYGEDAQGPLALHREHGPNARIVNCRDYVSLRAKRSTGSARLAKVPLGAMVMAFPEFGGENGFTLCEYQDKTGYILTEYLELSE